MLPQLNLKVDFESVTRNFKINNNFNWKRQLLNTRATIVPYAREFLGTFFIVIFGNGANCQVNLSSSPAVALQPKGNWTSLSFGWAAGVAMGFWVSNGGHINPAVTLALATYRDFSWRKVPAYILLQVLGSFSAAAVLYGNYYHAIDQFEGGDGSRTSNTSGLFGTHALDYMTNIGCFFNEFLSTTVFLIGLLTLLDKRNRVPSGLIPVGVFILVFGIAACLGMQTGFAINPARDLGPRLLTSIVGYGRQVYNYRNQYWIWCPILGPIMGAQAGTIIYDTFVYTGRDSLISKFLLPVPQPSCDMEENFQSHELHDGVCPGNPLHRHIQISKEKAAQAPTTSTSSAVSASSSLEVV
ncbi:hypothetical protein AMATHDRAFT_1300 [Amanita thiersii Skay4041]|uniref:Aquaporin n=1 Tax=Amanita thiersii Skay4041 TaxID=703135 RepID=A0A2A9NYY6_9AGAR|nr:hypothetical protein AMATHDRAFT_1300 [Amanita thiersii Skay4041]